MGVESDGAKNRKRSQKRNQVKPGRSTQKNWANLKLVTGTSRGDNA